MSRILFFTSWYNEAHEARRAELETCVRNCLESPDLDMVYLLCEGDARFPIEHPKLVQYPVDSRPKYTDYFEYANQVSQPNDILICSNSDIYPETGMRPLLEQVQEGQAWVLARWDVQSDFSAAPVLLDRHDAQDLIVVRSPFRQVAAPFFQGCPGSDNAVARRLDEAGYQVMNPARDVKFLHLHLTQVHNYQSGRDTVPAPYLLIHPTHLGVVQPNKYTINWQPDSSNPLTPHTVQ